MGNGLSFEQNKDPWGLVEAEKEKARRRLEMDRAPTRVETREERELRGRLNPMGPNYIGDGWIEARNSDGSVILRLEDKDAYSQWQMGQAIASQDRDVNDETEAALDRLDEPSGPTGPAAPINAWQQRSQNTPQTAFEATLPGAGQPTYDGGFDDAAGVDPAAFAPRDPTTAGPPEVPRDKIDPLLEGLNTYANDIYALSKDNTGLSVAEAQLAKATELANIQAGIQTDQSKRSAIGAARSVRSRGDRALAERQAIGESSFIGQEAARTAALRQAQNEGDLAVLRATEFDNDRKFRLEALTKASDLGLNTAALEVDLAKADLNAASNYLNQQFGLVNTGMQIDAQKAGQILQFTRDMAAIQYQYDQLTSTEKNEAAKLIMQKYQIDQTTFLGLEKIKADGEFDWNQLMTTMIAGGIAGGSAIAAAGITGKP